MSNNMLQAAFGGNSLENPLDPVLYRQGIIEHALTLGMDPEVDEAFLWIAEKSLLEPIPCPWVNYTTGEGEMYYYNQMTGETSWEHPRDDFYRRLFLEKKTSREPESTSLATGGVKSSSICVMQREQDSDFSRQCEREPLGTGRKSTPLHHSSGSVPSNYYELPNTTQDVSRYEEKQALSPTSHQSNEQNDDMQQVQDSDYSTQYGWEPPSTGRKSTPLHHSSGSIPSNYYELSNATPDVSRNEEKQTFSPTLHQNNEQNNDEISWQEMLDSFQKYLRDRVNEERNYDGQDLSKMIIEAEHIIRSFKQEVGIDQTMQHQDGNEQPIENDTGKDLTIVAECQELRKQLNTTLDDLSKQKDKNDKLEKELSAIKEKEEDFLKQQNEAKNVKIAFDEFKSLSLSKEQEHKDELKKIQEEQKDNAEKKFSADDIKELQSRISFHETTIKQMRENNYRELEESKAKVDLLQTEIAQHLNDKENKEFVIMELRRSVEVLEQSRSSHKGKIQTLEEELKTKTEEANSTQDELAHCKDLLEEALKLKDDLDVRIKKLEDQIQSFKLAAEKDAEEGMILKEKLETEIARVAAAGEEIENMKKEMTTWKDKYQRERQRSTILNSKVIVLQGNIRVFCRIRPLSLKEKREIMDDPTSPDLRKAIQYLDEGKLVFHGNEYEYDRVFAPNAIQGSVFSEVASAVACSMDGHNVCIFAYGQTGSGKTHTMEGPKDDRGVNYRALAELFELAKAASTEMDYIFLVSVLEVYNETLNDLLVQPSRSGRENQQGLSIHMRKDEVYVEGLVERKVKSCEDVEQIMALSTTNRQTASNNVNEHSSRSHLVLSVKILGRNKATRTKFFGKLNLIDLAGSERLKSTSAKGQRLKEAQNINRSLSALGDVISALGNGSRHIPYRNSKLTFLLQDSLKSNATVLMFVNINPAPKSAGESTCSLKFAERCRQVKLGKSRRDFIAGDSSPSKRMTH